MRKFNILVLVATFFLGYSEFIEPSLENRKMVILSPSDQAESGIYQQTFWWERQADALNYRLQIVSPKFDSTSRFILDTLIKSDKFLYTLEPGKYEWRVRAENGSSATSYIAHKFVIYPSSLKDQSIQLLNPESNYYTSDANISFSWLKLYGASQYRIQVDNQSFTDEGKLTLNVLSDNTIFMQKMQKEGSYQFRVRAENASENSKWSAVRNFVYDITPPLQPDLVSPANKQAVALPIKLLWNKVADAEKYELFIYQKDSVTLYNSGYPNVITVNEQILNSGSQGETLVWRIRAIDRAGNRSAFSDYKTFTIQ